MAHRHGPPPGAGGPDGSPDVDVAVPVALRRLLVAAAVLVALAAVVGAALLRPTGGSALREALGDPGTFQDATVTAVEVAPCSGSATGPDGEPARCELATVRLTDGPGAGGDAELEAVEGGVLRPLRVGDEIVVGSFEGPSGRVVYFQDFQRRTPLGLLAAVFVVAVVALGRWRGVRALVALGLSLVIIVGFAIPAIVDGRDPLATSLVAATLVMVVVLYVTEGPTLRATVALLGTGASLLLIALLGWAVTGAAELTGAASDEASFLRAAAADVDLRGLLLGGVVLGALGVLDDVTVTQVSATWELRAADPGLRGRRLYRAAARIGRDHVASTVNTLVLAYAGASLPLLILFTQSSSPLGHVLTGEVVAVEVVRTLVGSIGLVAAVPLTTALAAAVLSAGAGRRPAAGWSPPAAEAAWRAGVDERA